jgi:hypothetical protein
MLVIEKAVTGAGEGAAAGLISPAKLRQYTVTKQGARKYARGQGDFSGLGHAGNEAMTPLPNSGTAGRLSAQNLGIPWSSIVGGGVGYGAGESSGGLWGAAAGALLPRAAGRLATSKLGRKYLANQKLLPKEGESAAEAALRNAFMATQMERHDTKGWNMGGRVLRAVRAVRPRLSGPR